jgi:hypothetical protein
MKRCLNPTSTKYAYFEQADDTSTATLTSGLCGLWLTAGPKLWSIYGGNTIYYFEDTLTGSPTLSATADGSATVETDRAVLSWQAMTGPGVKYDVYVNESSNFLGVAYTPAGLPTSLTSIAVTNLPSGRTYYWRVRVSSQKPLRSEYSSVWSFSTAMGAAPWSPFFDPDGVAPSPGAQDVVLSPTFQWNAAEWATGYEFVLADNPDYTSPLVDVTATAPAYAYTGTLDYLTTYYWKVRAVSDTSSSAWAYGAFTTLAEAEPPVVVEPTPPPQIVIPPAEQITPAYIWAIIAIGGVLVIAMIVLIVRTRRPM